MARKKTYIKNFKVLQKLGSFDPEDTTITAKVVFPERAPDFVNRWGRDASISEQYCQHYFFEEGVCKWMMNKTFESMVLCRCPLSDNLIELNIDDNNGNWTYADKEVNDAYKKWLAEKALGLI